jgi:endonuclease G, mitochondrial
MISFILPNKRGFHNLEYYVCTTDSLEQLTNIDFFPILEDKLEEKLESEIHTELWTWTASNSNYKTKNTTLATQCRGTTQKGLRCKNRTKNQKGYCHYHD